MREPILDRVRKLLALAENAGSEHEAALAAKRASELMAKHEIHEAELRVEDPTAPAEPIQKATDVTTSRKVVHWHFRLAQGVAASVGCKSYAMNKRPAFFGRLSAVQTATYTTQYLIRAVEELCDKEHPHGDRSYRNAWRLGCASRIRERLIADSEIAKSVKEYNEPTPTVQPDLFDPPASAGALMVIERDHAEVDAAYDRFSESFSKRAWKSPQVSDRGGFHAGKQAGDRVNLKSKARGALPKGQGSLKR